MRLGVNLPWLDYGGDFGANAWHPEGGLALRAKRERFSGICAELRRLSLREVRLFVFCDGRTGLREDADGRLLGLDEVAFADMDAACAAAREHDLGLVPVLFDFKLFDPPRWVSGVRTGGRANLVASEDGRRVLIEKVIAPFVSRYATEPAIAAWDLFNEPEWAILGLGGRFPRGASVAAFRGFLEEVVLHLRWVASQPLTVGLASVRGLALVRGLHLGFHQVHWYDALEKRCPLSRPVAELGSGLPLVLGEFPTRGSSRPVEEILEVASRAGYAAAWAWSWGAADPFSDPTGCAERMPSWASSQATAAVSSA